MPPPTPRTPPSNPRGEAHHHEAITPYQEDVDPRCPGGRRSGGVALPGTYAPPRPGPGSRNRRPARPRGYGRRPGPPGRPRHGPEEAGSRPCPVDPVGQGQRTTAALEEAIIAASEVAWARCWARARKSTMPGHHHQAAPDAEESPRRPAAAPSTQAVAMRRTKRDATARCGRRRAAGGAPPRRAGRWSSSWCTEVTWRPTDAGPRFREERPVGIGQFLRPGRDEVAAQHFIAREGHRPGGADLPWSTASRRPGARGPPGSKACQASSGSAACTVHRVATRAGMGRPAAAAAAGPVRSPVPVNGPGP